MIGGTRSGYCFFEADAENVGAIVENLGLDARIADLNDPDTIPPIINENRGGCLSSEVFREIDGLPVYWIEGRPTQLELGRDGQFEYLLLLFNVEAGRGCIQVSYAYG